MGRKLVALFVTLVLCFLVVAPAAAVAPKPIQPTVGGSGMGQGHHITNAERKAAAVTLAKAKIAKGGKVALLIPGTNKVSVNGVTGNPGEPTGNGANVSLATPDYWGNVPNYANSPLPTSVSIQGDGMDAIATATVSAGAVLGITVVNGGTGYTFANVVVIGGGGSGATGTATITLGVITAIAVATPGTGYGTVPGLRKFVDALPGLDPTKPNDLGQYIPIAVADTTSFRGNGTNVPAADYYEIAVIQYQQKLHSDLPATTLRGYVQVETAANIGVSKHVPLTYPDGTPIMANGVQVLAVDNPQYLGPLIIAQKDKPVRVKFDNYLPSGTGGNLFLPVDPTIMGAGMGPTGGTFSQDRATLHLHGGVTPWISDGTQDQWTTPSGSTEAYPKGVSTGYVPDMWYDASGSDIPSCDGLTTCSAATATNNPGTGHMTFYYTNQQSARLMFYHDHAYGITRLNVYAGEAAGYLVQDPTEKVLVDGGTIPGTTMVVPAGTIPADQLPLVIEDKTFVPDVATQLAAEDPTWNTTYYGGYGSLWFPHVYMPNQNPGTMTGANAMGRWDYGAWFWPGFTSTIGTVNNPMCTFAPPAAPVCPVGENSFNPGTPNPSIVPESFMDTMTVNGTVYPSVTLQPKEYRFRILNASNDRTLNLSLFKAGTSTALAFTPCTGNVWTASTLNNNGCAGEVPMVPAVKGGYGTTGYAYPDQLDGRGGGVPDNRAAGPSMIQIGTEGGFLSKPVVLKNGPIGYNYNRRDVVVLNTSNRALTLGPAERADIIVDLSTVAPGTNLILYNDSPAPMPAFDTRYDYFTGDQDQVMNGGAPTTQPGYGPNTRTVMQIQVAGTAGAGADLTTLKAAIPAAYGQTQAAPVVAEQGYDQAFGTTSPADPYVRISNTTGTTFNNGSVTGLTVTDAGSGYTAPPTVTISGGGGAGAQAVATLNGNNGIATLTMTTGGSGYTATPTVSLTGGGGTGATAIAVFSTSVASVAMGTAGSAYSTPPAVTFTGGGGTGARGTATLAPSGVASVAVSAGGAYTSAPSVAFTGGGSGAAGTAVLGGAPVASVSMSNAGTGYTSAPTVSFTGGRGSGATGTARLVPTTVGSLTLGNPGSLYRTAPTVSITGGGGSGATGSTTLSLIGALGTINLSAGGTGYTRDPSVSFSGGGGSGATAAVSALSPVGVASVRMVSGGSCASRTPVPTVTITAIPGSAGSGARAVATIGGRPLRVTSVTITNSGSGYTLPPTVSFGGTNCAFVKANTTLQPASVAAISITARGFGYTSAPRVNISGGNGSGAAAMAALAFPVASIALTAAGSGYTSAPSVAIAAPTLSGGITATATATLTPTGIAGVIVGSGGSGYLTPPTVGFTGGGGTGAAAGAVLGAAVVASVTVTAPGSGYSTPPAVSFTGGGGTGGAAATATLLPTSVAGVTVTNGGLGYSSAPTVGFTGGGGSGAAATAALTPAPISGLTLTAGGSGYTSAPTVTITPIDLNGTGAAGTAAVGATLIAGLTITNPGSGYLSAPTVTLSGGGGLGATASAVITIAPVTLAIQPKGIQELFDPDYGRMNATMSVEIPSTNGTNQTTIPYGNIDPPTELVDTSGTNAVPTSAGGTVMAMLPDGTQIWKFTHNGVDTHSVHFHMFNIQLINRVGWDGAIRPPDPNEMGWKDTLRMSPLEDAIVAIKPIVPVLPWPLPNSIRPLDPAEAIGATGVQFTNIDPAGLPVKEDNHLVNFGWEYVFHCHLLGHEENDMMRPMAFGIAPLSPSGVSVSSNGVQVSGTFTDNSPNETGFTIQRSPDGTSWADVGAVPRAPAIWNAGTQTVTDAGKSVGGTVAFSDTPPAAGSYFYRVIAYDVIGDTATAGFPSLSIDSVPSNASAGVTFP